MPKILSPVRTPWNASIYDGAILEIRRIRMTIPALPSFQLSVIPEEREFVEFIKAENVVKVLYNTKHCALAV
jgi:hypothetical protein